MGSLSLTFVAAFPTFTAAHFSLIPSVRGAVAQLGERLNGIQEVEGSIPFGSTKKSITCLPLKLCLSGFLLCQIAGKLGRDRSRGFFLK